MNFLKIEEYFLFRNLDLIRYNIVIYKLFYI